MLYNFKVMTTATVSFKKVEEFKEVAERIFLEQKRRIHELLPFAEVIHVGSTAIPGSLTKGDVDLLVRVSEDDFEKAKEKLKQLYQINQAENWKNYFASFKDDLGGIDFGAQLVVKNSSLDDFVQLRDLLIGNPQLLHEYNQLKLKFEGKEMDEYRKEKSDFFEKLRVILRSKEE